MIANGYTGLRQISYESKNFVVCPACGEKDRCTEYYINGQVANVSTFRLPAIKDGTQPNEDGYLPLYQLICHTENGKLKVEQAECLDETSGAFFDIKNKQIIVESGMCSGAIIWPDEYKVGVGSKVYCVSVLWNFLVPAESSEASANG